MRNLVQYAIATAVLISGVVSQIEFNFTYGNDTMNGTSDNSTNWIPYTLFTPLTIPRKTTVRALLADLSDDTPVFMQWANMNGMFTFQWDFDTNMYSEEWRTNKTIVFSNDVVLNISTKLEKGKCTATPDATIWAKNIEGYFASISINEGIFADPFVLGSWP
jgi:hypothetical protein